MVLTVEANPVADPLAESFLLDPCRKIKIGALIFLLEVVMMEGLRLLLGQRGSIRFLGFEALRGQGELRLLKNVDILRDGFHRVEVGVLLGGALFLLFKQCFL